MHLRHKLASMTVGFVFNLNENKKIDFMIKGTHFSSSFFFVVASLCSCSFLRGKNHTQRRLNSHCYPSTYCCCCCCWESALWLLLNLHFSLESTSLIHQHLRYIFTQKTTMPLHFVRRLEDRCCSCRQQEKVAKDWKQRKK